MLSRQSITFRSTYSIESTDLIAIKWHLKLNQVAHWDIRCKPKFPKTRNVRIYLYMCGKKGRLPIQLLSVARENFSIQSMKPMTLLKGDIEECDSPDEATATVHQRAQEQAKSYKPSNEPR